MRPIDHRADVALNQALRCVKYRMPKPDGLHPQGYMLALALRYGLTGVAATHQLLVAGTQDEEIPILRAADHWSELVRNHLRDRMLGHYPFEATPLLAAILSERAQEVVHHYVPLYRKLYRLDEALKTLADQFLAEHKAELVADWSFLKRRQATRVFRECSERSVTYAQMFFERRQQGLEEVPEIALLGE